MIVILSLLSCGVTSSGSRESCGLYDCVVPQRGLIANRRIALGPPSVQGNPSQHARENMAIGFASPAYGRGWTGAGAFFTRRGPGEGHFLKAKNYRRIEPYPWCPAKDVGVVAITASAFSRSGLFQMPTTN
jgi:hypothetical protein